MHTTHSYFADRFDAIGLGVRFDTRGKIDGVGGSMPPKSNTPVSKKTQIVEAAKDGKVSKEEKTVFEKDPNDAAALLRGEKDRLHEAIKKGEGKKKVNASVGYPGAVVQSSTTEHGERVATLKKDKGTKSLDAIDKRIKDLKDAGATVGVDALKKERDARQAEERKVAEVIDDREQLIGTLEGEKVHLQAKGADNADAKDDYKKLREESQKYIDQLNENEGKTDDTGMHRYGFWGDTWTKGKKADFDSLAETFHNDPKKLENFAKVQGKNDEDLSGKSPAEIDKYLADLHDPELASKIAIRYHAAEQLQGIYKRYNEARDGVEGNSGRIKEIDDEIKTLSDANASDREALSAETTKMLDYRNQPIKEFRPQEQPAGTTDDASEKSKDKTNPDKTNPDKTNPDKANPDTNTDGVDKPVKKTVQIDYSKPEQRAKVLKAAQDKHLIPAANSGFDKQGNAVYTVQRGDSFWRISDQADGRGPGSLDAGYFQQTVNANMKRLGRSDANYLEIGDKLVLPGRNVDDLVKLLKLPTTEQVEEKPKEQEQQSDTAAQNRMRMKME